jgi:hypothetical protein
LQFICAQQTRDSAQKFIAEKFFRLAIKSTEHFMRNGTPALRCSPTFFSSLLPLHWCRKAAACFDLQLFAAIALVPQGCCLL